MSVVFEAPSLSTPLQGTVAPKGAGGVEAESIPVEQEGKAYQAERFQLDMNEQTLRSYDPEILECLLKERTTDGNIRWFMEVEPHFAEMFPEEKWRYEDEMTVSAVAPRSLERVISSRCRKSRKEQLKCVKNKAEVFTPTWVCNKQNNLVNEAWFGRRGVFKVECGEAPYLCGR